MSRPTSAALGAFLIFAGMVLLGFTDNFVRLVAQDAGLWQFHLLRSAFALPIIAAGALLFGLVLRPRDPGAVALRSAAQTLAMLLYFGALPMMPIAQVGAALFTAPIWVLIFAALIYGQRIGPRRKLAVGMGFVGVLAMLRPDPASLSLVSAMPLAAGALYGYSNLITRERCAEESVAVLVTGFFGGLGLVGLVMLCVLAVFPAPQAWQEAAPFLLTGWQPLTGGLVFWVLVQAAGALVGVGLIARGYQTGDTSALSVFEYSFLLTASFWAWVIWGERLGLQDVFGIGLILASGALIARAEPLPRAARRAG